MLLIQSFVNVARAALRCQVAAIAAVTMAGAALLGAQSAALAQAPATSEPVAFPINRPTLQVGDSWQYQRTDLWKNEVNLNKASFRLTSMTKEGNYRFDLTNFQGVASKFSSDLDLNGVKYKVQGEDMVQTWNKWPVTDVMSWEFAYKRLFDNGTIATYTVNCKINGLEKVVGPAGTFDVVNGCARHFGLTL